MSVEIQNPDICNAAQKMCDGARDMQSAVVKESHDALENACCKTRATIQASPYKSMLVALGVGAVVGALVFRR